eukprot:scaffold56096_cov60-Phaeocystis_antarctica.AAC.1
MPPPPHSLHVLRCRPCSQIPLPPHFLHWLRFRPCGHGMRRVGLASRVSVDHGGAATRAYLEVFAGERSSGREATLCWTLIQRIPAPPACSSRDTAQRVRFLLGSQHGAFALIVRKPETTHPPHRNAPTHPRDNGRDHLRQLPREGVRVQQV